MQKVLLVGGAGYVGSVLADELLQRGYASESWTGCTLATMACATFATASSWWSAICG